MSATATSQGKVRGRARWSNEPVAVRILFLGVTAVVVALLASYVATHWSGIAEIAAALLVWAMVAAVADLLPVQLWGDVSLSMSLPVTLAAGMVLSPWNAGLVAFIAALDLREFRGEVSVLRGLYNRSQIAASVILASAAFHALGGTPCQLA